MQGIANRTFGLVAALLLLAAGMAGCSSSSAREWTFTDGGGNELSLSDYRGRVVVLGFTNTWCDPCKEAAPFMQELQDRFADRGVMVMAISSWERRDPIAFMEQNNYTYGVMLDGTEVAREYDVVNVPTFYVIGTKGRVIFRSDGFKRNTPKRMVKAIEKHLKKHRRSWEYETASVEHSEDEEHQSAEFSEDEKYHAEAEGVQFE